MSTTSSVVGRLLRSAPAVPGVTRLAGDLERLAAGGGRALERLAVGVRGGRQDLAAAAAASAAGAAGRRRPTAAAVADPPALVEQRAA